jgi:F-type H+-transporting ATPase subunit gamma
MIARPAAAGPLAGTIANALERQLLQSTITSAEIVFGRPAGGVEIAIERHSLLPLDFTRFRSPPPATPPLTNLPAARLIQRLATEYLFAQLSEAILFGFAAENTARLAAMTAARDNVGRKLASLQAAERLARQAEITDEVMELAGGAEALERSR